jgi:hypothetical protein
MPEVKKYKKDGSFTKIWLRYSEEIRWIEERQKIDEAEDKWYYEHGIHRPLEWRDMTWQQRDRHIEEQKREKLSSELTNCVYCDRPVGAKRQNYFRRWNQYVHRNPIGTHRLDRKLEKETIFEYRRICFGCANTEYAIGQATIACEAALVALKREIRAQAY